MSYDDNKIRVTLIIIACSMCPPSLHLLGGHLGGPGEVTCLKVTSLGGHLLGGHLLETNRLKSSSPLRLLLHPLYTPSTPPLHPNVHRCLVRDLD
eukprot:7193081-Pyramimonas_sp.AAC.1